MLWHFIDSLVWWENQTQFCFIRTFICKYSDLEHIRLSSGWKQRKLENKRGNQKRQRSTIGKINILNSGDMLVRFLVFLKLENEEKIHYKDFLNVKIR